MHILASGVGRWWHLPFKVQAFVTTLYIVMPHLDHRIRAGTAQVCDQALATNGLATRRCGLAPYKGIVVRSSFCCMRCAGLMWQGVMASLRFDPLFSEELGLPPAKLIYHPGPGLSGL